MASMDSSTAFIKEYQERFEKKMKENEIALLEHWKAQLDKIACYEAGQHCFSANADYKDGGNDGQ